MKTRLSPIVAAVGATAVVATGVAAAGERWSSPHGPEGGWPADVVAVAASAPQDVYIGTYRGVFRSTDGGRSWVSAGPRRYLIPGVTSLLVDPRSPSTVYAGTNWRWASGGSYGQAVIKTTNAGRTWRALELRGEPIAITPTTVFAETGPRGAYHLVRSNDGGRTWDRADRGLPARYVWKLAFDRLDTRRIYAAMGRSGIFKSIDGGVHWRATGLLTRYGEVTAVAVVPSHRNVVYAATHAGIAVSLDDAQTWRLLNTTIRPHGRDRWYMQVSDLVVDPADPAILYATARCAGVLKSTDGGRSWRGVNAGLDPQCPSTYALALDPRAPATIYAADPVRGFVRSSDAAAHWHLSNTGLGRAPVAMLAVDPHNSRRVYAATGALGLFASDDGGIAWRPLASPLTGVSAVAVDPGDPTRILLANSTGAGRTELASGGGVAISADGGKSWASALPGKWIGVIAVRGRTAYAGSATGEGVFRSTDAGRTWRAIGPPGAVYPQSLTIGTHDPAVIYVGAIGAARGLYESSNGGVSWHLLAGLNVDVTSVVLDPQNASTLYVASNTGGGGVFRSTDAGASWQRVKVGPVNALAIDPADPRTLYAAAASGGALMSTDAGSTWQPLNAGLANRIVTTLAVDATDGNLYAAIDGGGVVSLRHSFAPGKAAGRRVQSAGTPPRPRCSDAWTPKVNTTWVQGHHLLWVAVPAIQVGNAPATFTRFCGSATAHVNVRGRSFTIRGGYCRSVEAYWQYQFAVGLRGRIPSPPTKFLEFAVHNRHATHGGRFAASASAQLVGRNFATRDNLRAGPPSAVSPVGQWQPITRATVTIARALRSGAFRFQVANSAPVTGTWNCG